MTQAITRGARAKARTVITTDGEVDDQNSFIRVLLYSNDLDLAGIVLTSSVFHYAGDAARGIEPFRWTGDSWPLELIDAYGEVYENLSVHDGDYPTPDYLRSIYALGNVSAPGEMDEVTPGSRLLERLFLDDDPRTLYVQTWGGTNTTARALRSIEERYANTPVWPQIYDRICGKLVLYIILDQDESYADYIAPHWPDLPVLVDACNFWHFAYAWKLHDDALNTTLHAAWQREQLTGSLGPLMARYALMGDGKTMPGELDEEQRGWDSYLEAHPEWERCDFISEGDSPSFFYLLQPGLRALEEPTYGGWGGRFGADRRNSVGDFDPHTSRFEASYTLTRWFDAIQNDFAERACWCVTPRYEDANHAPHVCVAEGVDLVAAPGETVTLTARASDPDGDALEVRWWRYGEADSYGTDAPKLNDQLLGDFLLDRTAEATAGCCDDLVAGLMTWAPDDPTKLTLCVPDDAHPGDTLHIICEVTDSGRHHLKTYQRVIVTVA